MVTPSPHFLFLPIGGKYGRADSLVIIGDVQFAMQSGKTSVTHP